MKVASVQIQQELSITKKQTEPKGNEFTEMLNKAMTNDNKSLDSKEDLNSESKDDDKEDLLEIARVMGMISMTNLDGLNINHNELSIDILPNQNQSLPVESISTMSNMDNVMNPELQLDNNKGLIAELENNQHTEENMSADFVNLISVANSLSKDKLEPIKNHSSDSKPVVEHENKDLKDSYSFKEVQVDGVEINKASSIVTKTNEVEESNVINISNEEGISKDLEEGSDKLEIKSLNQDNDLNIMENLFLEKTKVSTEFKIESPRNIFSNDNIQRVQDTIIQLVETTAEGQSSVLKVKLFPEDLGTVDVTLSMVQGKVTAKILVDNEHIKGLFSGKISELNESLVKQNIHIEKINVDINTTLNNNSSFNFSQGGSFNQNRRNYSRNNAFTNLGSDIKGSRMQESVVQSAGSISILA